MTVGEYLNNRKTLKDLVAEHGHKKARGILTKGGAAQKAAKKKLENKVKKSTLKSLNKRGVFGEEAEKIAQSNFDKQMKQLAALHDPDTIAGGHDKIRRMGDSKVNSSIGSQWKDRVAEMDKSAEEAMRKYGSDAEMNVELTPCKGKGVR